MTAPMAVTARLVEVVDQVSQLPPDTWDGLTGPGDFYQSSRWLAVLEGTSGVPLRVLLDVSPAGRLDGALVTVVADASAPWLLGRPDTLLERGVRERRRGSAELRATLPDDLASALLPGTVCGGRHLGRTRPLLHPGGGAEQERIDRLVAAAEDLARDTGTRSVSFLYVDEDDRVLREVLHTRGYLSHESGHYSWLPVPPGGLEEHLGRLSAHRARRIRAERRQLLAAGVESAVEPLTEHLVSRLAELETQLLRKHGLEWSPARSQAILMHVIETMSEDALLSIARLNGELVGFSLILRHRGDWYAHRAGFDYEAQGRLPVYFEVVYYRPIQAAAAAGVGTIQYGTGSAEVKRARGCSATRQFSFLRRIGGTS